jgi:hypothetical protein
MKTALIVLAGVLLRDAWCWASARVFVWFRQRRTQRELRENLELRQIADKMDALDKERAARILPYPQLFSGPLIIKASCDHDFLQITRALHANFRAQRKPIVDANFERN